MLVSPGNRICCHLLAKQTKGRYLMLAKGPKRSDPILSCKKAGEWQETCYNAHFRGERLSSANDKTGRHFLKLSND
jgi:hypothetical protein